MLRQIFVASAVTVSLLGIGAAAQAQAAAPARAAAPAQVRAPARAQAPAHRHPRPAVHLPPVRAVNLHRAYEARLGHTKPAKIAGIVYARGKAPAAPKAGRSTRGTCAEPGCSVLYNNGPVQLTPHIYLLLWGPNWITDTSQAATASYLESFYAGLGVRQPGQTKDSWSTILSQYGDSSGAPIFSQSVFAGSFNDSSTTPPHGATQAQIAAEADAFATTHGITDLTDAQIVVATQSGTCPQGFDAPNVCGGGGTYCAWHSSSNEPYINLPYLLDAGSACGEDFVNPTTGNYDGLTLAGGAEYANTVTNPFPAGGPAPGVTPDPAWIDTGDSVSGGEVADKCAWNGTWSPTPPHGDVTLSTGTFAMQSLWSNFAGACVMSDTVMVTSPSSQTNASGSSVSLQLHGTSSAGYPLKWSEAGLPPNLTMSTSGLITGTTTTPGTYSVTVTAIDASGTQRGVSFNWIVTPVGAPITGANGKCLDDSGGITTNGNKIDIWTCNSSGAQKWTLNPNKTLAVLGSCLSDRHYTGAGTKLVLWSCVGHRNEQWTHRSNGEYVLATNGLCLTDPSDSAVNGTQVQIRACKNFKDQHWSLP